MKRRTFVTALAAGSVSLAGCGSLEDDSSLDDGGGTGESNETDGGSGSEGGDEDFWQDREELRPDGRPEPTAVTFETAPITAAVPRGQVRTNDGMQVTIDFERGATSSEPATLETRIVNTQPYEQTVRARRLLVLDSRPKLRTRDRETVYLAPTDDHPLAESVPTTERDDDGRWRLRRGSGDWFPETVTFGPEQGFTASYHLVAGGSHDDPPVVPGRYRTTWRDGSLTVAVWPTDEPGPAGDTQFAGADPPALPRKEEMAWYHEATSETGVFLRPDTEAVELPAAVSFEFINHSHEQARGNPFFWRIHKLVDGQWLSVHPWAWNQPDQQIPPGGREESTLGLYHGEPVSEGVSRTVGHLGGGRYAYETGYAAGSETHAVMLEVGAPAVTVDIEPDAVRLSDTDPTTVVLPNHEDARRPAKVVVEPTSSEDGERVIPEQLPRRPFRALRNALPLLVEGADSVEVRTDRGTALRQFGYEEDVERTVEYLGETYRATGELLE